MSTREDVSTRPVNSSSPSFRVSSSSLEDGKPFTTTATIKNNDENNQGRIKIIKNTTFYEGRHILIVWLGLVLQFYNSGIIMVLLHSVS